MTPSTDVATVSEYRALTIPEEDLRSAVDALREQEVGEFDLTRIKIPTGGGLTWTIPGARGEKTLEQVSAVVIFSKFSRGWWAKPFSGGNEPPACASPDGRTASARPDMLTGETPEIPAQRDDTGHLICDTCSYAEFGTKPNPQKAGELTRGQWCKQMRQIFLLLPDRLLPAVLTLPPTSLKSAKTYFLGLVDEGIPQHAVVTEITLHKEKNEGTPEFAVATFKAGEALSSEQAARAYLYAEQLRPRFMRVVATSADLPDES